MHQFKGFDDWIEVFEGGWQTDSRGRSRYWSDEDLDQIVANHSADDPFPAVIGHPKTDDPAYGWGYQLKRAGKKILAKFGEIEPQFAKMVESGRFKKRSSAIAKGENGFFIRHVGWLGAKAPAVEGLAHPAFSDEAADVFEFQTDWRTPSLLGQALRRMREYIIGEKGVETADKHFPEHLVEEAQFLTDDAKREPNPDDPDFATSSTFSQHDDDGDPAVTKPKDGNQPGKETQTFSQADIDSAVETAVQAERDKHTSELEKERRARQLHEHQAFVDELNAPPALTAGMAEFMLELSDAEDAQFEFAAGEGDKHTKKQTPLAWFQAHVGQLKGKFDHLFQEQGGEDGGQVDTGDPEEISRKALEFQKSEADAGRHISISQAVHHVTEGARQ